MKVDDEKAVAVFDLAGDAQRKFSDAEERRYYLGELRSHMQDISDDPSGTEPEKYLGEEDVETLNQFLAMAKDLGWADAEPIVMGGMRGRELGLHAWTSSMNVAKSGLFKTLFLSKTGDAHRGYVFARLNVMPTQRVAICEDGRLRSERGTELIRSKGVGWGALPEPDYLRRAIKPTNVLLNYDSRKFLANSLVSRIHPKNLPPARRQELVSQ